MVRNGPRIETRGQQEVRLQHLGDSCTWKSPEEYGQLSGASAVTGQPFGWKIHNKGFKVHRTLRQLFLDFTIQPQMTLETFCCMGH